MPPIFALLPLLRGGRLGGEVILGRPHELPIKILVIVNLNAIPLRRRPFVINIRRAIIERRISNRGHAVRYRNARQPATTTERTIPYLGHAVWNFYARQPATITERITPNFGHVIGKDTVVTAANYNFGLGFNEAVLFAPIYGIPRHDCNMLKPNATNERITPN